MFVAKLVVVLVLLGSLKFFVGYFRRRIILRPIPSFDSHWIVGCLMFLIRCDPEKIMDVMRSCAEQYWPIYKVWCPFFLHVNILTPEDFELILSPTRHLSKNLFYKPLTNWLGEGLLTSTGVKWQIRRRILTPTFHFNILQQYVKIFNEETRNLIKDLEHECTKSYTDMVPFVTNMTFKTIAETAMGFQGISIEEQEEYCEAIFRMSKIALEKNCKPWLSFTGLDRFTKLGADERRTVKFLHDLAYKVIIEREKELLKNNALENFELLTYSGNKLVRMLDLLLISKIKDKDIDLDGIREEVDTFMFEGHDTTAAAITFLLLCLANNPDVQDKVREELFDVIGPNDDPTYNSLQELKYTERAIKETLRLFPSVHYIGREASQDFTTHTGYRIPKGTMLSLHIFDMHRDARIYTNPLKFDPDRFLPENVEKRHPFAYLPFSAGPRNCIGQKFAMLEVKAVICGMLRNFVFEAVDKQSDIVFTPHMVLKSKNGVRIKIAKIN